MCRRRDCEGVPILAYGHYPLEVVTHPPGSTAHGSAAKNLHETLARNNISVYVAGHLHSAFGEKLHRLHKHEGELHTPMPVACNLASPKEGALTSKISKILLANSQKVLITASWCLQSSAALENMLQLPKTFIQQCIINNTSWESASRSSWPAVATL